MKLRALVTTVGSAQDARRLADAAVDQRLAACVQITAIESVYRWQGAVQHEPEWRLLFKTTEVAEPALRALILERHPYALPALYALDALEPSEAYREWVVQNADRGSAPST
jgi:periplasmic divalent cation tolerance protein